MGLPPPPGASNPADDDELSKLCDYLTEVAKIDDFGALDHSRWREPRDRRKGGVSVPPPPPPRTASGASAKVR